MTDDFRLPAAGRGADRGEKICLGELDDYIGFHLRLAQNASFKAFKRQTGQSDLRPGRFAVLALIHHNPGITPMALSLASGRDKSTITPVLRDLQRAGMITRTPVPRDKRSHSLHLTQRARRCWRICRPAPPNTTANSTASWARRRPSSSIFCAASLRRWIEEGAPLRPRAADCSSPGVCRVSVLRYALECHRLTSRDGPAKSDMKASGRRRERRGSAKCPPGMEKRRGAWQSGW